MIQLDDGHPEEEVWRRYFARSLPEPDKGELEKHLNDCEACRSRIGVILRAIPKDDDQYFKELFREGREAAGNARILEEAGENKDSRQDED